MTGRSSAVPVVSPAPPAREWRRSTSLLLRRSRAHRSRSSTHGTASSPSTAPIGAQGSDEAERGHRQMSRALFSLAGWVVRNRRAVVIAWVVALVAGGYFSLHQSDRLSAGGWAIPGSQSQKTDAALKAFPAYAGDRFAIFVDAPSAGAAHAALARARSAVAHYPQLHAAGPPLRFLGGRAIVAPYLLTRGDEVDFADTLRSAVVADANGTTTRVLGDGAAWSNFEVIAKQQLAKGA